MANNACSTFRYVAICHPFISHTMSKLSRAVKFVIIIWLLALCMAVPQAVQFGIVYDYRNGSVVLDSAQCSIKWYLMKHTFEASTMLFFVLPMTIITVLYVLIAIKLRRSRLLSATAKRNHLSAGSIHGDSGRGKSAAQRNVIRMLGKWNVSLILYLFPFFFSFVMKCDRAVEATDWFVIFWELTVNWKRRAIGKYFD